MKKKVLLSSIATIALCLCLIAGSTFALFTSESVTNITITSGNVDVVSSVVDFKLFSVKATEGGSIIDENGGNYEYEERTDTFANGGTAVWDASVITLENITPGDMISFGINTVNSSDVAIQCRYIIECISGEELMDGLIVYINGEAYPVLKSYTSAWVALDPNTTIDDVQIAIELPVTAGNEYQEKSVAINVVVEAVQGNADVDKPEAAVVKFLDTANATVVTDAASLQAALDNTTEGDNMIVVAGDIVGDVVATQKANTKTTIYGNGYTFEGVLTINGKSATIRTAEITVKDFVFSADSVSADACIRLGGNNSMRYVCNASIVGCTFDVPEVVGVKSYTGGDYDISIINCTATARAHSLAQLKGVNGLVIENCTVNASRGVSLNNSNDVVIDNCVMDVQKYAIRFGESNNSITETYTITDCVLKSACVEDAVIVFRAGALDANVTLTGTTLEGPIEMIGHEGVNFID